MKCIDILNCNFQRSIDTKTKFLNDKNLSRIFCNVADLVLSKYKNGGKLYIFGNGGSAADSQHIAAEFVSKLSIDRESLPAEAITTNSSIITAIGNDYGFSKIFSRQLEGCATSNDIALAISTSGNSSNIVNALKTCKQLNISSVLFSGSDGGKANQLADYSLLVPSRCTTTIQEVHITMAHALCEFIESKLFRSSET